MTDDAIRHEIGGHEIGGEVARLLFEGGAIHVSRQQPFILAAGWAASVKDALTTKFETSL
jgi:orotate phosphoribosyltransferase